MWTMIVADDDISLCGAIASFARDSPRSFARVREANSVDEAVAAIDEHPTGYGGPLLVLSDFNLRDHVRTGIDVLRHARARHPRSLRLLMSGEDPESLPRDLHAQGVHAFLEKPFFYSRIEELVHERARAV